MDVKKGKKESVEGPVKGFFMVVGGFFILMAIVGFFNADIAFGLISGGIGVGIFAIASRFKNKTRITY